MSGLGSRKKNFGESPCRLQSIASLAIDDAIDGLRGEQPEVHRLRVGLAVGDVEASEPQQVVQQAPHPAALAVDPLERGAVPGFASVLRQRQARVRAPTEAPRGHVARGVGA